MGITFGGKEKKSGLVKIQFFDGLIDYAKSTKKYYERGYPALAREELNNVLWYAEELRKRIKREHPEFWK